MEHRYTQTTFGKIHATLIAPTIPVLITLMYLDYIKGKESNLWGLVVCIIGFLMFLKAKLSVVRHKKLISFGCDLMDQKHTSLYFLGWVTMILGYFLSWSSI